MVWSANLRPMQADSIKASRGEKCVYLEEAARRTNKAFTLCVTDRCAAHFAHGAVKSSDASGADNKIVQRQTV